MTKQLTENAVISDIQYRRKSRLATKRETLFAN